MRWVPEQSVHHSPDRCVSACLDLLIAWSLETCCFGLATSPHIRAAQLNPNMPSARSIFRLFLERKWLTLMRVSQLESPSKHAPWLSSSSIMFCWTLLLICSKCGFHAYLLIQQAITVRAGARCLLMPLWPCCAHPCQPSGAYCNHVSLKKLQCTEKSRHLIKNRHL